MFENKKFQNVYLNTIGDKSIEMQPQPIKVDMTLATEQLTEISNFISNLDIKLNEWNTFLSNEQNVNNYGYDPEFVKDQLTNIMDGLNSNNIIKQKLVQIQQQITVLNDVLTKVSE